MWYLIIPPIVVVVSLSLLIWFLSNRSEQVSIQERMKDISKESSFREWQMLRFKQMFFRFLEKGTRSLKVASLRVHNFFHGMGQSFHEKRHQSDIRVTSFLNLKKETQASFVPNHNEVIVDVNEAHEELIPAVSLKKPKESKKNDRVIDRVTPTVEARPMVSERAVIPETKPNKIIARDIQEEERLIKKIAANPKNISAYEALGDYYLERGDVNDAKACYRQVLKLSPVHRMVKVKIRKLERLIEGQGG